MNVIRLLIVRGRETGGDSLRAALARLRHVESVFTASAVASRALLHSPRPHVALAGVSLAENRPFAADARAAGVPVLFLSEEPSATALRRALSAGASGFALTTIDPTELEIALRAAAGGDFYLCPKVARGVVGGFARRTVRDVDPRTALTPRQCEVLRLVAEGYTTRQIAGKLDIGAKTVETHRGAIMDRLGIRDVAGLARYAVRVGLVDNCA